MTSKPVLLSREGSLWSDKARWALSYSQIPFHDIPYQPIAGELRVRWHLRKWSGPVSMPSLLLDKGGFTDSYDIARWADSNGSQPGQLFPQGQDEEIKRWNDSSDALSSLVRINFINKVLEKPAVVRGLLPGLKYLGFIADALIRLLMGQLARKYQSATAATSVDKARKTLTELRQAIQQGKGHVVGGQFTLADIGMALGLTVVKPLDATFYNKNAKPLPAPLEPGLEDLFVIPPLAEEFGDLLPWRDSIVRQYWQPAAASPKLSPAT